ncbi:MAG: TetR/AcrR family transcriptional regulator [Bifidobacteriaceae bacterium]|nr:TetR/AcrR family transcriptional regulator [Bifidobacteriaceae bacterium]
MRERRALETRRRITECALDLIERGGYDATTMEIIAEAAVVSPATVYRYFGTKDAIVLEALMSTMLPLSEAFAARPASEPLAESLGAAVLAAAAAPDENAARYLLIRSILDDAPASRARLWDYLAREEAALTALVAARMGTDPADLEAEVTARVAIVVWEIVTDRWRSQSGDVAPDQLAHSIFNLFAQGRVAFPSR